MMKTILIKRILVNPRSIYFIKDVTKAEIDKVRTITRAIETHENQRVTRASLIIEWSPILITGCSRTIWLWWVALISLFSNKKFNKITVAVITFACFSGVLSLNPFFRHLNLFLRRPKNLSMQFRVLTWISLYFFLASFVNWAILNGVKIKWSSSYPLSQRTIYTMIDAFFSPWISFPPVSVNSSLMCQVDHKWTAKYGLSLFKW